jgi:hypothetical protein
MNMSRQIKKELAQLQRQRDTLFDEVSRAESRAELRLKSAVQKLKRQARKLEEAHYRETYRSDRLLEKTVRNIDNRIAILKGRQP